nr:cuticle protein 21-like [Penaeus vannamei]
MNTKIILVLAFAAVAAADRPSFSYGAPRVASRESFESFESTEAKYDFQWAVDHDDSGNDFGHQEARDNDNTQGSYYVHLPDGRLQTVRYVVDGDNGYVADVSYEGEARYDSVESGRLADPSTQPPDPSTQPPEHASLTHVSPSRGPHPSPSGLVTSTPANPSSSAASTPASPSSPSTRMRTSADTSVENPHPMTI